MLLYVHRDRTIRDGGEPRTATSTFTQLLGSDSSKVQCCFTSTETVLLGTGSPGRPPRLTFTQFLGSDSSKVQCCFTSTETVLLGTGSPGRPPRLTFTQFLGSDSSKVQCCFTSTETVLLGTGSPAWPPPLSHSSRAFVSELKLTTVISVIVCVNGEFRSKLIVCHSNR